MKNYIIAAVTVALFVIGFFVGRATLSNKQAEQALLTAQGKTALIKQKDDLETAFARERIDSSKVIQNLHKKISDGLKPVIRRKIQVAVEAVDIARKDTNTTENCKDAINKQEEAIFDLGIKAYNDSIQIYECNKQNGIKEGLLTKKDRTIAEQNQINTDLSTALKKQPGDKLFTPFVQASWNSFGYVGAGAGIYIHNVGIGAKYMTDFKNKGYEVSGSLKF